MPVVNASSVGGTLFDFYRLALHEFGHAAGLDHPNLDGGQSVVAVMNSGNQAVGGPQSAVDHLQADDIAGAHAIAWVGGGLVAAVLPSSRSVQVGTAATAFATIINLSSGVATGCSLAAGTSVPATFTYQTTNPATNQLTGTVNTPTNVAAGASQSFVFAFTPTAAIAPTDVILNFACANAGPAPSNSGLNTLLLSASTTPIPDVVALGATLTSDGIVNVPGATGTGVFAVATVNVGASGVITASADTGGVPLPVTLSLCQTDPTTGQQYFAEWLAIFPGRFVSIALGTNDALGNAPPSFVSGNLSTMAQQAISAGKVPVIPLIPWSCDSRIQASGPGINDAIRALWANNPQIVPGPDFWSYFQAHPTQLSDCIHPTVNEGTDAYRKLYADRMLANVYQGAADTQPPTAPSNASATATSSTQITLTWTASTDNVGVTGYQVERCAGAACTSFAQVATATATTYNDTGLASSSPYRYRVRATDAAGNLSAYSNIASATTLSPASGLVAAYAFGEGAGTTTADATGKGHTGTLQGGASWTASGKYGSALSFNGSTSYVDLGNAADLQLTGSMTWSAWIFASANPPDDGQIIAKSGGAGWQFKTSPDTGVHTFGVGVSPDAGSLTQRYSATVRQLGTWYHVAGVYDATARTLNIYVNGVLDNGALSGTVPASQYNNAAENVTVGRRSGGFYFAGTIDEVRLYNRALSQAEIQSDMNTPIAGP